jgi:hypothetical protein
MSIRQIRAGIRAWLESQVRIDAWDLDVPANLPTVIEGDRFPANSAVEAPVQDLTLRNRGDWVEASGLFVYGIVYRFSGKAAKEQLPVAAVEALVNFLLEQAVYAYGELDGCSGIIKRVEVPPIEAPVTLARVEGEDSDWLVIARLEFIITFRSRASADFDELQPTLPPDAAIVLQRLSIAVNRAYSPVTPDVPATYTEDTRITLQAPPTP